MTEEETKGSIAFCYAVALAARELDKGQFDGLNCDSFLDHVERLLHLCIENHGDEQPPLRKHSLLLLSHVRRTLELHQADLERGPNLTVAWSRPEDE